MERLIKEYVVRWLDETLGVTFVSLIEQRGRHLWLKCFPERICPSSLHLQSHRVMKDDVYMT